MIWKKYGSDHQHRHATNLHRFPLQVLRFGTRLGAGSSSTSGCFWRHFRRASRAWSPFLIPPSWRVALKGWIFFGTCFWLGKNSRNFWQHVNICLGFKRNGLLKLLSHKESLYTFASSCTTKQLFQPTLRFKCNSTEIDSDRPFHSTLKKTSKGLCTGMVASFDTPNSNGTATAMPMQLSWLGGIGYFPRWFTAPSSFGTMLRLKFPLHCITDHGASLAV